MYWAALSNYSGRVKWFTRWAHNPETFGSIPIPATNQTIKGDHMNSQDILLYTAFTVGALYGFWIIINIVWFGILSLYHYINDEITFYKWNKKR